MKGTFGEGLLSESDWCGLGTLITHNIMILNSAYHRIPSFKKNIFVCYHE